MAASGKFLFRDLTGFEHGFFFVFGSVRPANSDQRLGETPNKGAGEKLRRGLQWKQRLLGRPIVFPMTTIFSFIVVAEVLW